MLHIMQGRESLFLLPGFFKNMLSSKGLYKKGWMETKGEGWRKKNGGGEGEAKLNGKNIVIYCFCLLAKVSQSHLMQNTQISNYKLKINSNQNPTFNSLSENNFCYYHFKNFQTAFWTPSNILKTKMVEYLSNILIFLSFFSVSNTAIFLGIFKILWKRYNPVWNFFFSVQ